MHFFLIHFISLLKGKKIQTFQVLCDKCPLNLIRAVPPLAGRTAIRRLWQLLMGLSRCCGGLLEHSSVQNCFNSATLKGLNTMFKVMPKHLLSLDFNKAAFLTFWLASPNQTQPNPAALHTSHGRDVAGHWAYALGHKLTASSFSIFWYRAEFMAPSSGS